jgi:nitrogen-specific signal transduction histidine kinase
MRRKSREIRNALTIIRSFATIASRKAAGAMDRESRMIYEQIDRISAIMDENSNDHVPESTAACEEIDRLAVNGVTAPD